MKPGWVRVVSPIQEHWLQVASVQCFITPGKSGKPIAWPDEFAAEAILSNGASVALSHDEWKSVQDILHDKNGMENL